MDWSDRECKLAYLAMRSKPMAGIDFMPEGQTWPEWLYRIEGGGLLIALSKDFDIKPKEIS